NSHLLLSSWPASVSRAGWQPSPWTLHELNAHRQYLVPHSPSASKVSSHDRPCFSRSTSPLSLAIVVRRGFKLPRLTCIARYCHDSPDAGSARVSCSGRFVFRLCCAMSVLIVWLTCT